MSPADLERAGTWITEIVETILEGVTWRREGDEYRTSGHGGLTINAQRGCWYQHSSGKGGWSVISLVVLLKGCDNAAAAAWVEAFLRAHPGTGSTTLGDGDDEREVESA